MADIEVSVQGKTTGYLWTLTMGYAEMTLFVDYSYKGQLDAEALLDGAERAIIAHLPDKT